MARLHREMMRVLIADIATDVRHPGERLPREADLAEQFGVSRGVARECIRGLEERGLITVRHGKGATVNAPEHWNVFDPDVLAALLDSPRSVEVLTQYLECRRVIEIEAAGFAAQRAGADDLARLSDALARMEASTDRPSTSAAEDLFHEADMSFHESLIAATGNRALGNLAARIRAALLAARYPLARPQYRRERALPEHRRILAAVADGDVEEARAAMHDHLATVERYLRDHATEVAQSLSPPSR
jgi:GntR family transcriptional repressor for pyruvate dehydrogenase complex